MSEPTTNTCPRCTSPVRASIPDVGIQFECATIVQPSGWCAEGLPCVTRQRDQLAERVRQLTTELRRADERTERAEEQVRQLEAVLTDPHALWANWLRGTVKLPAGIGDVRECSEKMKRFRSRWLAAHQELRKAEDRIEQLEAALRECAEWIYWESTNDSREATDVECYQRAVNLLKP